jgi:ankyrin repeat domain-containing protein 50
VQYLSAFKNKKNSKFANPGLTNDQLYDVIDSIKFVNRFDRLKNSVVHYNIITSGSSLVKNSKKKDKLKEKYGILCFKIEIAGLINNFPCVIIRGVCDYVNSHKNKRWQPYAAVTAAVYAKYLSRKWSPEALYGQYLQ